MKKNVFIAFVPLTLLVLTGCKPTSSVTLTSITPSCQKTEFIVGQTLKKSDIQVTATYSDKTTKVLVDDDWTCTNHTLPYTFKDADAGKGMDFKISYSDKQTAINVSCVADTVTALTATTTGKTTYYVGETFEKSSINVEATFKSGKKETIASDKWSSTVVFPYTFVDADMLKGKTFDIMYLGAETSVNVKPIADALDKIEATVNSQKTFNVGSTIEKSDITVTATYLSTKTETITSDKWTSTVTFPYSFVKDDATSGKTFDISYGGKDTTVKVNPTYIAVTGISCKNEFIAFGYWDEGFADYSPDEFEIKVSPDNASNKGFTIESSDSDICYYDEEDEEIRFPGSGGECTLTIKSKDNPNITTTCAVKANRLVVDPGETEEFEVGGNLELTFSATYDDYLDYTKAYWTIDAGDDLTITPNPNDIKKATVTRKSGGSGDGDAEFHVPTKDGTMNFTVYAYINGAEEPAPELTIDFKDGDPDEMHVGDQLEFTLKDKDGNTITSGYDVEYEEEGVIRIDGNKAIAESTGSVWVCFSYDGYEDLDVGFTVNEEEPEEPELVVTPDDVEIHYNNTQSFTVTLEGEDVTDDCAFEIEQEAEYLTLSGNTITCITEEEDVSACVCVTYEDLSCDVYVWINPQT